MYIERSIGSETRIYTEVFVRKEGELKIQLNS